MTVLRHEGWMLPLYSRRVSCPTIQVGMKEIKAIMLIANIGTRLTTAGLWNQNIEVICWPVLHANDWRQPATQRYKLYMFNNTAGTGERIILYIAADVAANEMWSGYYITRKITAKIDLVLGTTDVPVDMKRSNYVLIGCSCQDWTAMLFWMIV